MKRSRCVLSALLLVLASACGGADPAPSQPAPADPPEHAEHGEHGHGHGHGHDVKKPIGHTFDDAEKYVAHFESPERDAWQKPDHVVSLLGLQAGMTVADIGAGTGYFLPRLSAAVGTGGKVIGVDISRSMVDYMTKRAEREGLANVSAVLARTDDPGLADGSVDRIIIVNTWHHIPERNAYAAKLLRALRPGGEVYVVDFTMESPVGPPPNHRLLSKVVIEELTAGGLRAELVTEELDNQYVVRGTRP